MRQITSHQINDCNRALTLEAGDPAAPGNAPVQYNISGLTLNNGDKITLILPFQNGPPADGVNGITHEVLLAILIDRLRGFQSGPYSSRENALALTKLEEAVHWLGYRTAARVARGVEGTHKV